MEHEQAGEEPSAESEFATTVRLIDLYIRQKTDLFLQHYVFEPFAMLGTRLMYLTVVLALLVVATVIFVAGAILLIATQIPLWASLILCGIAAFIIAGIIAYTCFLRKIVLETPTATEMMNRGKE